MPVTIFTGDAVNIPINIKRGCPAVADPVADTAVVTAIVTTIDHEEVLIGPAVQSKDAPGADWPNGLVVVQFTKVQTAAATRKVDIANIKLDIDGESVVIKDHVSIKQGHVA